MAFEEGFLEIAFASIVATGFGVHRQKHIGEGIVFLVWIRIYFEGLVHFLVLLCEEAPVVEYIIVLRLLVGP